jgi:hypothetical protein
MSREPIVGQGHLGRCQYENLVATPAKMGQELMVTTSIGGTPARHIWKRIFMI